MRKKSRNRILKREPIKQYINTVFKSCHVFCDRNKINGFM